jgi:hypothetical protein
MRTLRSPRYGLALIAWAALVDCSSSDSSLSSKSANPPSARGVGVGGKASYAASASGGSVSSLPPETEIELPFGTQVAAGRFVWAANQDTDRVALVDAVSGDIWGVLEAGFRPTYLAAVPAPSNPDIHRALVINVGSHDVTLLEAPSTPTAAPVVPPANIPVHADANAWAVSAQGRWAIVWTDPAQVKAPDPTQGFQDVTVLGLADWQNPTATRLSVGYRPSRVFISQDEQRAFAVTDPGITVIDLSGAVPAVLEELAVTEHPLAVPPSHDVSITPDGVWAVARHEGSADVHILELGTGKLVKVTLPGAVTDLDLVEGGSSAVAVVRQVNPPSVSSTTGGSGGMGSEGGGQGGAGAAGGVDQADAGASGNGGAGAAGGGGQTAGHAGMAGWPSSGGTAPQTSAVAVLPIPGIFLAPGEFVTRHIPGQVLGSVATTPGGTRVLLYSNAAFSPDLTILDTVGTELAYRTVSLVSPISSVRATPDGSHAIALLDTRYLASRPGAFAVIPISEQRPARIQGTDAPTQRVAISPDGKRAVVTVRDDQLKRYGAYLVSMPELNVDLIPLSSPPTDVGMVPAAERAFVAQAHPEGRVTLINLVDGSSETRTGFELGVEAEP